MTENILQNGEESCEKRGNMTAYRNLIEITQELGQQLKNSILQMTKISIHALCNELQMMSVPRTCQASEACLLCWWKERT